MRLRYMPVRGPGCLVKPVSKPDDFGNRTLKFGPIKICGCGVDRIAAKDKKPLDCARFRVGDKVFQTRGLDARSALQLERRTEGFKRVVDRKHDSMDPGWESVSKDHKTTAFFCNKVGSTLFDPRFIK